MSLEQYVGKNIGRYQVLETLGVGGMSTVYRAHDPQTNRAVAIKVMQVHVAANETMRMRFEREARTIYKLRHPHILPLLGYGEEQGMPYMVMPLMRGGTPADMLKSGPLPIEKTARIVSQIARALDYAHQQGIIHRDLKPANILMDESGAAFLTDFGVARITETSAKLTGTGDFLGTAAYASPEQCLGEEPTAASDIYSFGIMLYEFLTGEVPFQGTSVMGVIQQHISETVPNPLRVNPTLPIEVFEVVRKATTKIPTARYSSAAAMSDALVRALRKELQASGFVSNYIPLSPDPHPTMQPAVTARLGVTKSLSEAKPAAVKQESEVSGAMLFLLLLLVLAAVVAVAIVFVQTQG